MLHDWNHIDSDRIKANTPNPNLQAVTAILANIPHKSNDFLTFLCLTKNADWRRFGGMQGGCWRDASFMISKQQIDNSALNAMIF